MLGLGTSVGTDGNVLQAEGIVVTSFDDLKSNASLIPGKIVIYNQVCLTHILSSLFSLLSSLFSLLSPANTITLILAQTHTQTEGFVACSFLVDTETGVAQLLCCF